MQTTCSNNSESFHAELLQMRLYEEDIRLSYSKMLQFRCKYKRKKTLSCLAFTSVRPPYTLKLNELSDSRRFRTVLWYLRLNTNPENMTLAWIENWNDFECYKQIFEYHYNFQLWWTHFNFVIALYVRSFYNQKASNLQNCVWHVIS